MAQRRLAQFFPAVMSALPLLLISCAPLAHLSFPAAPLSDPPGEIWYDVNGDGTANFALQYNSAGRVDSLIYKDDAKREQVPLFTSSRFTFHDPPHLILLLDSIPYQMAADRYAAGHF